MRLREKILYNLSKKWQSPVKSNQRALGEDPESEEYLYNYALKKQYNLKVKSGIKVDIWDKTILEIGCGHGGISAYLAINGAKKVVGIDLNTINLKAAKRFTKKYEEKLNTNSPLPIQFLEMNAYDLEFEAETFDIIFADNVFEHFMKPEIAMQEACRVLKKDGILVVPVFSSIWSKNALHLKNGLKVPWANLMFSEKTICNVMVQLGHDDPKIQKYYPGVKENPQKVRDLRRYKDLNDITHKKFKKMAIRSGFEIVSFNIRHAGSYAGKLLNLIPILKDSIVMDVFSVNAGAILRKK